MIRQLETDVKAAFDAIVAHTPDPGPTPTHDLFPLTLGNATRSTHRAWLVVAAASIVAVGVGAVASLSSPPGQQAPLDTPSPSASNVPDSTITYATDELIPVGAVVCLDAGAGQAVIDLCVDELGGDSFAAGKTSAASFVMPIDPANAEHQASAVAIADRLGLPVGPFDASFIPIGITFSEAATVFLVVGISREPYAALSR